jgi:hypothetical protein
MSEVCAWMVHGMRTSWRAARFIASLTSPDYTSQQACSRQGNENPTQKEKNRLVGGFFVCQHPQGAGTWIRG